MKSSSIIKITLAVSAAILMIACEKASMPRATEITDFNNKARVQLFNATAGSPGNLIVVNGAVLNNTAPASYGIGWPTNNFFITEPGTSAIIIRPSSGTTQPALAFPTSFKANTFYSIFTYDTLTSPKQVTVESAVEIPSDTTARLRFANFMYSKTQAPNVDIFSVKRNGLIFSNIATSEVTPFVPYASRTLDTLIVRQAGTTTVLGQFNGFSATPKRVYTAVLRGSYVTITTTPKTLSILTNM